MTFLNTRRAIGGMAAARRADGADSRRRCATSARAIFYLAGYRVGDLRRYKKLYNVDLWQHGTYSGPPTVAAPPTFGTAECFPIPLAEINGNPGVNQP